MAPRQPLRPLLVALAVLTPLAAAAAKAPPARKMTGPMHPAISQGNRRDAVIDEALRLHLAVIPALITARAQRADVLEFAAELADLMYRCQTRHVRVRGQALPTSPVVQKACLDASAWDLAELRARFPFLPPLKSLPLPRRQLPRYSSTIETDHLFSLHLHAIDLVRVGPTPRDHVVYEAVENLVHLGLDCMRQRPLVRRLCDDGLALDLQMIERRFPTASGAHKKAVQKATEEARVDKR